MRVSLGLLIGLTVGVVGTLAFQRVREQQQRDEEDEVLAEMIRERLEELEARATR